MIRESVFRGNEAGEHGGAISMFRYSHPSGFLEVSQSVFVENIAGRGGAIAVEEGAARLTNVTMSGNMARDGPVGFTIRRGSEGAALYGNFGSTVSLVQSTLAANRAGFGALFTYGRLELAGSVVADSSGLGGSQAPNCAGGDRTVQVSTGFNLADDDSCGLNAPGDQLGEPELGPLIRTGGTFAHVPLAGSPLVDGAGSVCPETDQLGIPRPLDGDRDGSALCDIGAVEALSGRVRRVFGLDRVATAVAVSQASLGDQEAEVVVLARADGFADGLAGGPLAAAGDGPLLLTGRDGLDPGVEAELLRVLPEGGEVVLLGGAAALRAVVEERVAELGYRPVRVAGSDRYATAVAVAGRLDDPQSVLLASGTDFPDALSAGAAAAAIGGAVLLTVDDQLPAPTRAYLNAHPGLERIAVGGPAAAADPGAEPLVGPDRYSTAVAVARRFHDQPTSVGIASGLAFPDALAAASDSAERGGPLLLSSPDRLPAVVAEYLVEIAPTLADAAQPALIYGGEKALSLQVEAAVDAAL